MKRNPVFTQLIASSQVNVLLNWLLTRDHNLPLPPLLQGDVLNLLDDPRLRSLAPLLYQEIRERGLEGEIPVSGLEWLRNFYLASTAHTLRQQREVGEILRALSRGGIVPILLKGIDARLRLYGNPVVRPMSDLDLLIAPEELPAAQKMLSGLGYASEVEFCPEFERRFLGQIHLNSDQGRVMADLHWYIESVANFYCLPYPRLREKAVPWEYEGQPARLLAPEHLLIHLCLHNYDELLQALQLLDLGLALTRLPLDWSLFLQEAEYFRVRAPLFLMLEGLNRIFPEIVPQTVLASLGRYRPSFLEALALHPRLGKIFSPLARLGHLRPSDWAAYLGAIFWPDPEYLAKAEKTGHAAYWLGALKKYFLD